MTYLSHWYSIIVMLVCVSCSHYVSGPDIPSKTDTTGGSNNMMPRVFLAINVDYESTDERWILTLDARSARGGSVIRSIGNASLWVNGFERSLIAGFPYDGKPEKLFLTKNENVIYLELQAPNEERSGVDFVLEAPVKRHSTFLASRTSGLVTTISPPIRKNEVVEVKVYKDFPGSARLVTSSTFTDEGSSSLIVSASDFMNEIGNDSQIIVGIARRRVEFRDVMFTDGIELTESRGGIVQHVTMTP